MDLLTVERLREAIDLEFKRRASPDGFPNLPRIPVQRYLSADFLNLEIEGVFDGSWLVVGTMWDFQAVGSFKVFDNMGRAEVLLVRGEDGKVRAFYNTCRHRGATVIRERSGIVNNLKCQFHSWTYGLDGNLKGLPDSRDFDNDPSLKNCALTAIRCETWAGFVFINLNGKAPDLETWLGPVAEDFAWIEGLRPSHRREQHLACNWRVALEAFVEGYHIGTVHPTTVAKTLNYRGSVSNFYPYGHSRMVVPRRDWNDPDKVVPENDGHDEAYGFRSEVSIAYNVFPNLIAPTNPNGFTLLQIWPVDEGNCRLVTLSVRPDEATDEERLESQDNFDAILEEDIWNMEHIQLAYQSPGFEGPKIGVHEKRIYFIEQMLDRMIGPDRIPEDLQVPPLLDKYIVDSPQDV